MSKLERALALVDRFEEGAFRQPSDAERLLVEIFEACGHAVSDKGFVDSGEGVDCFIRTNIDGNLQTIGVEIKLSHSVSMRQL
jgi:hypothetical protein